MIFYVPLIIYAFTLNLVPGIYDLKDHKDNFQTKLPCRLINSCKNNLCAVSKSILDQSIQQFVILIISINGKIPTKSSNVSSQLMKNRPACLFK